MTDTLFWLTMTALMTALFWAPYVLQRMAARGIAGTLANPSDSDAPQADWALRSIAAHKNGVENLAVFAALALVANATGADAGPSAGLIGGAAMIYFLARLAHFVVYTLGVPALRTVAFLTGWACQVAIALALLGVI